MAARWVRALAVSSEATSSNAEGLSFIFFFFLKKVGWAFMLILAGDSGFKPRLSITAGFLSFSALLCVFCFCPKPFWRLKKLGWGRIPFRLVLALSSDQHYRPFFYCLCAFFLPKVLSEG